jgi:AcrR family transcriptional regulator
MIFMAVTRRSGRPAKIPGEKSTKGKIFDASLDMFAERGYDGVSIRDIASAVGIKESSIYKHYASKEEILDTIVDYLMARVSIIGPQGVEAEELIISQGLEGFMAMASGLFTNWAEDTHMVKAFRVIFIESYHNKQIGRCLLKISVAARTFWESNFEIMLKHKLIKPYDPEILSLEFLSFIWNAYMDYFLFIYDNTTTSIPLWHKERIDRHVAFIVSSIKP